MGKNERVEILAEVQSYIFKKMEPVTSKELLSVVKVPDSISLPSQFSTFLKENADGISIEYTPGKNKKAGTWMLKEGSYVKPKKLRSKK